MKLSRSGALLLGILSSPAFAYSVFPIDANSSLKWGSNLNGTPGGIVTWSLMPDGTTLDPGAPGYIHGTSNLTGVFDQVGGQSAALAMMQQAFAAWSARISPTFSGLSVSAVLVAPTMRLKP